MTLTLPRTGYPNAQMLSTITRDMANTSSMAGQTAASAVVGTIGRATFFPVRVSDTRTYTKAWWLNGTVVNGNTDVGIYTISGTTATRIAASTAEAQAGASLMQVAATFPSTTLTPGLYYIALATSSATATYMRMSIGVALLRTQGVYIANTSHPLPSTATVITNASTIAPIFGFSERAEV